MTSRTRGARGLAGAVLLAALAAAVGCRTRAPGEATAAAPVTEPVGLYWTTDRAVDRLDIAHMARSLSAGAKSDEDKAIAVWKYVRRTMYHYPMRNERNQDQGDTAKLINVYGYAYCWQQASVAGSLAKAMGMDAHIVGIPGHLMYEVRYGDRWHLFCAISGFWVRTRDADRHIASAEEIRADPTLATKAREEGRASKPFMPCAGGPEILGEAEGTRECPRALTYRAYDAAFVAGGVAKRTSQHGVDASRYSAWVPLRRGESLRLDWAASGKFLRPLDDGEVPVPERFWPPRHICGEKDRANPFFNEIAAYGREFGGPSTGSGPEVVSPPNGLKTYRYYGSGVQVWRPRLDGPAALAELARAGNLAVAGGAIRPERLAEPAVAEFEMTGAYPYVDAVVTARTRLAEGAGLKVRFQGTDPAGPWREMAASGPGANELRVPLSAVIQDLPAGGHKENVAFTGYRFRLRFELSGAAELSALEIRADVQHNWLALPQLAPGGNIVTLRARRPAQADPARLAAAGAVFELAWEERDAEKCVRRPFRDFEESFKVVVKGRDFPRMHYALLARE